MNQLAVSSIWIFLCGVFILPAQGADPPTWRPLIDQRVPMRDGVELSADVFVPRHTPTAPALLVRTPYNKNLPAHSVPGSQLPDLVPYFTSRGYALVVQDVRGRGDSDGEFIGYPQEVNDGHDTIGWIADQPWSNGDVCFMGVSYLGQVQWLAAKTKPPALKCMVSTAAHGLPFEEVPYKGGVFMFGHLDWAHSVMGRLVNWYSAHYLDMDAGARHRPLLTADVATGRLNPLYRRDLEHDRLDDYHKSQMLFKEDFERIDIPVLHVTGWFDGDQPGAMYFWEGMRNHSPARDRQYLLVGPWQHAQTFFGGATEIGHLSFTPDSVIDVARLHLDFYDHFALGTADGFDFPRARIYVTGANVWRDYDDYPPAEMTRKRLYLHSDGRAGDAESDNGSLTWQTPGEEPMDRYRHDPDNPVPLVPKQGWGPGVTPIQDLRPMQIREDVLVYSTEPLDEPVEIIGDVTLELYAASDSRDTDFLARLIDVFPDGMAVAIGQPVIGAIRARFRDGFEEPKLLEPGAIERYAIELDHFGHKFLPGHRIGHQITSSAYPVFSVNTNTGNPIATDTESRIAAQTIYHDEAHPSALILPVMPAGDGSP